MRLQFANKREQTSAKGTGESILLLIFEEKIPKMGVNVAGG
jgi:hypothetical protein